MLPVISPLLSILNQIKIYHWQTYSFAQHKSFDEAYGSLSENVDEFVETYQGIFGRIKAETGSFEFSIQNLSSNYVEVIDGWISYFQSFSDDSDIKNHSDLLNIRDEMLGNLNQLKYLLTLN